MAYAYEEEDELQEIPIDNIVIHMTEKEVKKIIALGAEYYDYAKKNNREVTYEQCQWQAFSEYVLDKYGEEVKVITH